MIQTITAANCFESVDFCQWWNVCSDVIVSDRYAECILGCADDGWALDALIDCYGEGMSPAAAVKVAVEGWGPSDSEMLSTFGTKWHDGL
jgi:hypothetical protein